MPRLEELFAARAALCPESVAIRSADRTVTYHELSAAAEALAASLRADGVRPGTVVAVLMNRSVAQLTALLGIWKAGAVYLPLDPQAPDARLAFQCTDGQASLILTDSAHWTRAEAFGPRVRLPDGALPPGTARPAPTESGDIAYYIYTSGSTGTPKGVRVQHDWFDATIRWQSAQFPRPGRTLQFAALGFDVSIQETLAAWSRGDELVVVNEDIRRDPAALLDALDRNAITRVFLPYVALQSLATTALTREGGRSLTEVVTAGEQLVITPAIREFFLRRPGCRLENQYGPSEAPTSTSHLLPADPRSWDELPPIGTGLPDADLRIDDADPAGVGELIIVGRPVAAGYTSGWPGGFGETDERPSYRTGDLVALRPDGQLQFAGRADRQVKIRGVRVEPAEIEARLAEVPGVRHCAVVSWHHDGRQELGAFLVATPDSPHAGGVAEHATAHLVATLPAAAVPAVVTVLGALPQTESGKLDRQTLTALLESGEATLGPAEPVPGAIDQWVRQLAAALLPMVPADDRASLRSAGLHSLAAARIAGQLEAGGVRLSVAEVLACATLADLIAAVVAADGPAPEHPEPGDLTDLDVSRAQRQLALAEAIRPGTAAYTVPLRVDLAGTPSLDRVTAALNQAAREHDVLRTGYTFGADGDLASTSDRPVRIQVEDLREHSPASAAERIAELTETEARCSFALDGEPLWRCTVVLRPNDRTTLLLTQHHLITDRRSLELLLATLAGSPIAPPARLARANLIVAAAAAGSHDADLGYWRDRLDGCPAGPRLPGGVSLPSPRAGHGERTRFPLPVTRKELLDAAERWGVSPYVLGLTAFVSALRQLTHDSDHVIGTAVSVRPTSLTQAAVGLFVNTVPIRLNLPAGVAVAAAMAEVASTVIGAVEHAALSTAEIISVSGVANDHRDPLLNIVFGVEHVPLVVPDSLFGTPVEGIDEKSVDNGAAQFELAVHVDLTGDPFIDVLRDIACYPAETAELLMRVTASAIGSLCAATPESLLGDLGAGSDREAPGAEPVVGDPVDEDRWEDLIAAYAHLCPDALAVVQGDADLTYAELSAWGTRIGMSLSEAGVRPGDRVAVCVQRSPGFVAGLLGVLTAGAAYVPLDPAFPDDRLGYMLADSGATVVLSTGAEADRLEGFPNRPVVVGLPPQPTGGIDEWRPTGTTPQDTAYVIYTSGSTGQPKGVPISHRQVVRYSRLAADRWNLSPQDRVQQFAALSVDVCVDDLFPALYIGATVVLRTGTDVLAPGDFLRRCADEQLTVMKIPTAYWHELCAQLSAPGLQWPPAVRLAVIGGEAAQPAAVAAWRAALPDVRILNLYGPTESTVAVTMAELGAAGSADLGEAMPIGRELPGVRAAIVGIDGSYVPVGGLGELYLGGPQVAVGYHSREDLTAERFMSLPGAHPDARYYRTGDLVRRRPDGQLEFRGRADDQVKVRGFRVELGEVEAALGRLDKVTGAAAALCTVGDATELVGFLRLADGAEPDLADIREQLTAMVPAHLIPTAFHLVKTIPTTPAGKIDRRALARRPGQRVATVGGRPPESGAERAVAHAWSKVLGVPPETISASDRFADLGGNSLNTLRVVASLKNQGWAATAATVLAHPTLDGLAASLAQAATPDQPAAGPQPSRTLEPGGRSEIVKHLWGPTGPGAFCVHWAAGNIAVFRRIQQLRGSTVPVYGVQSVGLDGREEPLDSVTAMAERYLTEIRAVQTTGPYLLIGFCFGARITIEMARRLRAANQEVRLILIDPATPNPPGDPLSREDYLSWRIDTIKNRYGAPDFPNDIPLAMGAMKELGVVDEDAGVDDFYALQHVYCACTHASDTYDATVGLTDTPIVLLRSASHTRTDTELGTDWRTLFPAGVTIHDFVTEESHLLSNDIEFCERLAALISAGPATDGPHPASQTH